MGKRFVIWLFVCFCIQNFVVADKVDTILPQAIVFNEWVAKANNCHFSEKIKEKQSFVKKQKKKIFKKFKLRTKIYTKLFPFVRPEHGVYEDLVFHNDAYFYGYYLSAKPVHAGLAYNRRGPPSFS